MPGGWIEVKDGDESALTLYRRHYSRRVYRDGRNPRQFIGPGRKKPLLLANGKALFAWREHISDDGQVGVNCAVFRNEDSGELASDLIRQAVAIARARWWPMERFYTYIDPRKLAPTMFRGYPVWGWCFYKAGWKFDRIGKGGKHVLFLPAIESGATVPAVATSSASPRAAVAHSSSLFPVSPSSEAAQGEEHGESASPEVAHKSSSLTDLATECAALWTQIEQDCPHHGNCACAITTRHEAFDWFCNERERALNAEATVAALVSALQKYGQHKDDCASRLFCTCGHTVRYHLWDEKKCILSGCVCRQFAGVACTCGLDAALASIDAPQARHAGARESETKKE